MIELGSRVKDLYTGFVGTAVARTDWLFGCIRYSVEPTKLNKDGSFAESVWIDEQRLTVVKKMKLKIGKHFTSGAPGGPRSNPKRPADPTR